MTSSCAPPPAAALGRPSQVALSPAGSLLDLHIRDPQTNFNSSMRDLLPELGYRISYWEGPAHLQVGGATAPGCQSVSLSLCLFYCVPPVGLSCYLSVCPSYCLSL